MLDVPAGRVAYAVLSFVGFLGIGNKLFAIPWDMLTVDEDRQCLVLDVDKKTLEDAPGFDKDHWPLMADLSWGSELHRYYNRDPYWAPTSDPLGKSNGERLAVVCRRMDAHARQSTTALPSIPRSVRPAA